VPPAPKRIKVAHLEAGLQPLGNVGKTTADFSGDEGFASPRTLMVEQQSITGKDPVRFTVIQ
jgi:hypothetical protein